jgi:hypothetical protein
MTALQRRRVFVLCALLVNLIVCAAVYTVAAWWRGRPIHDYLRNPERRTQTAGLFRSSAWLGYAAVPGAEGAYLFPGGGVTPIKFDARGFREAPGATPHDAPMLMTLGCSYSFGDAVPAEQTFTFLAARHLQLGSINAALSGYGLAQMTLLAQRLVPELRPRVLLVEYAPWLIDRAIDGRAPAAFGDIPTPYFTNQGKWDVAPPHFETSVFEAPFWMFANRGQPRGELTFLLRASLPYFVATDANRMSFAVRRAAGRIKPSSTDRLGVVREAYGRMQRVAEASGARMLVFALAAGGPSPAPDVIDAITGTGATFVDADEALKRLIVAPVLGDDAYQKRYAVWAGTPPRMIDPHPNTEANRVIADAIVSSINQHGLLTPR